MSAGWAGVLAAAALLVARPAPVATRRLRRLFPPPAPPPRPPSAGGGAVIRRLAAGLAGLGAWAFLGGPLGVAAGVALAVAGPRLLNRLSAADRAARPAVLAELPVALELIASALAAGAPLVAAVQGAAEAVAGPLGSVLNEAAGQLRLGADPARAWRGAAAAGLRALVETISRSGDSGAALGPALRRLAADERAAQRRAQETAIRRLEVLVVLPLGTCFLPAFLLLGVVPVVAGLARGLLP